MIKNEVFEKFKELFTERCDRISLLNIREDSVRYDFYAALSKIEKLDTWDLQLEWGIEKNAYVPRKNTKSKREENPQLDMIVDKDDLKISIEFALFRQNSNDKGQPNNTKNTVKMMNDIIRLSLDSKYTKRVGYFICVADYKILGHQLNSKILGKFPSDYLITKNIIEDQKKMLTSDFDDRFINVFNKMDKKIEAKIVYNEEIKAKNIVKETRIIVWKTYLVKEEI